MRAKTSFRAGDRAPEGPVGNTIGNTPDHAAKVVLPLVVLLD